MPARVVPGPVRTGAVLVALLAVAALLGAGALVPAVARADGDPASDALIAQNVFYPYSSPVPAAAQSTLNAEVAAAHRAGVDLKVALIARSSDLGAITALYHQPQRYAAFLDTEISFERKIPLLVVMPNGYGTEGLSAIATRKVLAAPPPTGTSGADLAAAATAAIRSVVSGAGHVASGARSSRGSDTGRTVLLLGLILAALLVTGTLVVLRVFFPPREDAPVSRRAAGTHRHGGAGRGARPPARSRRGS